MAAEPTLADLLAAAERVLHDVNHNVRVDDSIALATFVRDLLTNRGRVIGASVGAPEAHEGNTEAPLRIDGRDHWFDAGEMKRLAADLLRAAEAAKGGR